MKVLQQVSIEHPPTHQLLKGDLADEKTAMLQEFAHFHPALIDIIRFVGHPHAIML